MGPPAQLTADQVLTKQIISQGTAPGQGYRIRDYNAAEHAAPAALGREASALTQVAEVDLQGLQDVADCIMAGYGSSE